MGDKRYARVMVRAAKLERLGAFLASRTLDLGGRPHQTSQGWAAEFYIAEVECEQLAAEGCEFEIDKTFFERLQAARLQEEKVRLSEQDLKALLKKGEFPSHARDATGRLRGND